MSLTKKDKVLWVTNAFGVGGAEKQMLYMYHIMQEYSDFDISILYYAKMNTELPLDGINALFVDKDKLGKIQTIKTIHNYIKENNIKIMHALGGCSANIYGRAGAVYTKAVSVGAILGKKHFVSFADKLVNSILNLFGNWWTANNMELIPILNRDLLFLSNKKIRMLHNGFVPAERIDFKYNEITEYDKQKGKDFVFCAIGRLQPVKNYSLFIEAASIMLQNRKNVQFWIIGNGDEYDKLKKQIVEKNIQDKVILWGNRDDVDVALSRCDVFVQTSITEGSPNTIAEAMRAQKPIISTRSTDLSEMIEEEKNGYIVESNSDSLLSAMNNLILRTEEERIIMGNHSYDLFIKHFKDDIVAQEYISFYNELLGKR